MFLLGMQGGKREGGRKHKLAVRVYLRHTGSADQYQAVVGHVQGGTAAGREKK
jgi:hypothetical protein